VAISIRILQVVLAILIVYMSVVAVANIIDWKVDFFSINPSEQHHSQVITLFYPPSPVTNSMPLQQYYPISGDIGDTENFSVNILLQYDGTLAEGTPVNVTVLGSIYPKGYGFVTGLIDKNTNVIYPYTITTGFEGAIIPNGSYDFFGTGKAELPTKLQIGGKDVVLANQSSSEKLPVSYTITWETQGDYSPYLEIPCYSSGVYQTITVPYSDYKVYVASSDVIRQENYSRIQTALTIVLFIFTLISGIDYVIFQLPVKQREDNTSDEQTRSTNVQQQNAKRFNILSKDKTKKKR